MNDPRLLEIKFLAALDRERPTSLTWWEWAKRLAVSQETFTDVVFGLFRDGCLEGTSTITPPSTEQLYNDRPVHPSRTWGEREIDRSVRTLLSGANSFQAHINHAGRLRLYRLRDEILQRDRIRDDFEALWAHRHWLPDLDVRLSFREPNQPLAVILLAVDKLKTLNTELGNPGADQILEGVFEILRDVVRPHDAYRLGGDEAGSILPGIALAAAERLGEEIKATVVARHWRGLAIQTRPTVSVGVGTINRAIEPTDLNDAVDRVRKRAKAHGNKVVSSALPEGAPP